MFDQMVRVAASWDWVTPMATFVQNLPDKGTFLHRKIQYDAWFMAPELEGMLKQVPTNPWPALMPDVTDWKQPLFPGNAGGPPIVMKPAQIGQGGQMSGHRLGQHNRLVREIAIPMMRVGNQVNLILDVSCRRKNE